MHVRFVYMTALLALTCTLLLKGQDGEFKLKVDVPVVSLDVIIQDANNRPVTGLGMEDFQIYEDGVLQEIRHFDSTETPRSTLLLFDATGVMESQGPFMAKATNVFLANVRPQDRVAVAAFGSELEMLMNFRKIEPGKASTIKLPPTLIGSNIYESLTQAGRRINNEKGRKAIVVLTDGRDTYMFDETKRLGYVLAIAKDSDFQKQLRDMRKREIPIYFVALDTDPKYL